MSEKTKVCKKCGGEKYLELFSKDRKNLDGRSGQCLICEREYQRRYHTRRYRTDPAYRSKIMKRQQTRNSHVEKKICGVPESELDGMINEFFGEVA